MKELNLSCNDLRDAGVQMLSQGLNHANCILETLRLVIKWMCKCMNSFRIQVSPTAVFEKGNIGFLFVIDCILVYQMIIIKKRNRHNGQNELMFNVNEKR